MDVVRSPQLRVLFLNPPHVGGDIWMKEVGRCGRRAVAGEVWPQTGLAYLAAAVEREGHLARIIDGMAEPVSLEALEADVHDWEPDLLVANSATPTIRNDALVLDRLVRASSVICGFVGPHASALPEETLRESTADFVLVNEAEETVAELVRVMGGLVKGVPRRKGDKGCYSARGVREALAAVRGMVWCTDRHLHLSAESTGGDDAVSGPAAGHPVEILINDPRPLIENLDDLPMPARHLLPNHAYRLPFFRGRPFTTVIPGRGCPWPCSFCRAGGVWGRRVRHRSVSNVLEELETLVRDFDIRNVVFMTDSLTLKREWTMELLERMGEVSESIEWLCNSRVDAVDKEMLRLMQRAGCRAISYGVESGSQDVIDRSRKGITLEKSERAIRLTREAGIASMAYFILGLPGETHGTVEETIAFAKRLAPDYVNFHVATPFPGTDLYEEALERNWLTTREWEDFEEEGSAVLQAGELTPDELRRAQARAMRSFYLRPSRLLGELAKVRTWPDLVTRVRAGLRVLSAFGRSNPAEAPGKNVVTMPARDAREADETERTDRGGAEP